MRTPLYFALAVLFALVASPSVRAQQLELGLKGGFSVYSGDLSPREFGLYLEDWNTAGGVYLRYRPTARFGVRINGNFGMLSAEREMSAPNEQGDLVPIPRNFRSSMTEFNAVLEYDLFYIGDRESNFLAPYVYGGLGVLSFNPEGEMNGVWTELQPLRTQAQGVVSEGRNYDATPYDLTAVSLILGGGVRVRFAERFVIGVELGGRKPGTDYLDDITDTSINYIDVLSNPASENAGQAARFSNPAIQDPSEVTDLLYKRGGDAEDYYFVGSLTVGITIGAGGSKKSGCYQF